MKESNIPDFALFADTGILVGSTGTNNLEFESAAVEFAQENNIHVGFVDSGVVKVARFNRGFPNGIEPFSVEAKQWAQDSGVYRVESDRWNGLLDGLGC